MPIPQESQRPEHPSTYVVQDRSSIEERTRLMIQDQLVTAGMGGVFPEQADPTTFRRILDVGCGTGGWLIEAATSYPDISWLAGVDVSKTMIDYARAQAEERQLGNRIEFRVMDALRMLEFPAGSFDLVNQRFGQSYMRTWDWPRLLLEFQRMCKPGGIVRITESEMIMESTSPALTHLNQLFLQTLYQAGHFFAPDSDGVISKLAPLLHQHGLQHVQTQSYALQYHAGTPAGQHFCEDMQRTFRTVLPFLRKWTRVPDDYEATYQQMLEELQQPDFTATWRLLTAWGIKPS